MSDDAEQVKEALVQEPAKVEKTFTQAELDKIISERVGRVRSQFADYDDLKKRAGETSTVEDRLAAMEKRAEDAEFRALRADVAVRHGITAADRDLFLTGSDEETLTAQAVRLAERDEQQLAKGNSVPRMGAVNSPSPDDRQAMADAMFGNS